MKTKTPTKTKMAQGSIKVTRPVRTVYLSKFEKYAISQSLEYWLKNAPKNPLESLLLDKFKEVQTKFNPQTIQR
jgi:DNA transposition AAA+ family ATPase